MSGSGTATELPSISVVVPVLDGRETLKECLDSLRGSNLDGWELIVVDDGSTDGSAEIAGDYGAEVAATAGRCGPGAARNLGAAMASGEILVFLDADCSVRPETLAWIADRFRRHPEIDALFGSYDDAPAVTSVVSRYKNLQHHHVHQTGAERARTFWAGCGAIRRSTFEALGGFDTETYRRPSIEDIELGYRLTDSGGRILLAKEVQVKHHKAWTLPGVLRSDLLDRGIPWTRLLLERRGKQGDLNLGWRGRLSVILSVLVLIAPIAVVLEPVTLWLAGLATAALIWLNRDFYHLLARRGGLQLGIAGILLHWIYHLNCALAYLIGHGSFWRRARRSAEPSG